MPVGVKACVSPLLVVVVELRESVRVRDVGSWEEEGREGGGGGEEGGSLGRVSSFVADSSVPFRPADPTRKVKHIMHYGGVNKKGVPKGTVKIFLQKLKVVFIRSFIN